MFISNQNRNLMILLILLTTSTFSGQIKVHEFELHQNNGLIWTCQYQFVWFCRYQGGMRVWIKKKRILTIRGR